MVWKHPRSSSKPQTQVSFSFSQPNPRLGLLQPSVCTVLGNDAFFYQGFILLDFKGLFLHVFMRLYGLFPALGLLQERKWKSWVCNNYKIKFKTNPIVIFFFFGRGGEGERKYWTGESCSVDLTFTTVFCWAANPEGIHRRGKHFNSLSIFSIIVNQIYFYTSFFILAIHHFMTS